MYSIPDLNGDGTLDVVCSSHGGTPSVSVLFNTGRQLFHTFENQLNYSQSMILTADLNADGWPDYVSTSRTSAGGVYFGLNLGIAATQGAGAGQTNLSRLFETDVFLPLPTLFALDTCDVNQDNYTDFVVRTGSGFSYLLNLRNNTFQHFEVLSEGAQNLGKVRCYDMDGDSYPDIIGCGDGRVWWFQNNGGHNFTAGLIETGSRFSCPSHTFADLDNDLRPGTCDPIDVSTEDNCRSLALTLLRAFLQI